MALSLPHLRTFVALADWRSVSRAAAALGVSQPAVSKSIRVLERELGVPLVVTLRGGVRLTEAGEALFVHARGIVGAVQSAEDDVAGFRTTARGTLRIAASTTIARYIAPPLLHEFLRRHPGVNVRLDSMHSRFVARLLLERQIEIALVEAPVQHPRIRVVPWLEDRTVVVAGASHRLARRLRIAPAALADELLLVREPGSGAHTVALAALQERGVVPARHAIVDCHEAIKQLLMRGTGIAIMPERVVAEQLRHGTLRILPVDGWEVRRSISRLVLLGRRPTALARAFDALLDAAPGAIEVR